jgi:hypothetical protein
LNWRKEVLKKNKFSPETDFEKLHSGLIEKIRSVKEEELSENFNEKLFSKIHSGQVVFDKKESLLKKAADFIAELLNPQRPAAYIVYAGVLAAVFFTGQMLFLKHDSGLEINKAIAKTEKAVTADNIEPEKPSYGNKVSADTRREDNERYMRELYKKVSENLDYGFANIPTEEDVRKIIASDVFKEKIGLIESPTIEDSVKIIKRLLEE